MSRYSQFRSEVITVTLTGSGETPEQALNQILTKMRRELPQHAKGTPLFMAPTNVEVTRLEMSTKTEKFLGLLWPRTRNHYEMEARLDVEVRTLQFTPTQDGEVNP